MTIEEKQAELDKLGAEILELMKDRQGNKDLIKEKQDQGQKILKDIEEMRKQASNTLPAETFQGLLEGKKTYEELLEAIPEGLKEEFEKTIKPELIAAGIITT